MSHHSHQNPTLESTISVIDIGAASYSNDDIASSNNNNNNNNNTDNNEDDGHQQSSRDGIGSTRIFASPDSDGRVTTTTTTTDNNDTDSTTNTMKPTSIGSNSDLKGPKKPTHHHVPRHHHHHPKSTATTTTDESSPKKSSVSRNAIIHENNNNVRSPTIGQLLGCDGDDNNVNGDDEDDFENEVFVVTGHEINNNNAAVVLKNNVHHHHAKNVNETATYNDEDYTTGGGRDLSQQQKEQQRVINIFSPSSSEDDQLNTPQQQTARDSSDNNNINTIINSTADTSNRQEKHQQDSNSPSEDLTFFPEPFPPQRTPSPPSLISTTLEQAQQYQQYRQQGDPILVSRAVYEEKILGRHHSNSNYNFSNNDNNKSSVITNNNNDKSSFKPTTYELGGAYPHHESSSSSGSQQQQQLHRPHHSSAGAFTRLSSLRVIRGVAKKLHNVIRPTTKLHDTNMTSALNSSKFNHNANSSAAAAGEQQHRHHHYRHHRYPTSEQHDDHLGSLVDEHNLYSTNLVETKTAPTTPTTASGAAGGGGRGGGGGHHPLFIKATQSIDRNVLLNNSAASNNYNTTLTTGEQHTDDNTNINNTPNASNNNNNNNQNKIIHQLPRQQQSDAPLAYQNLLLNELLENSRHGDVPAVTPTRLTMKSDHSGGSNFTSANEQKDNNKNRKCVNVTLELLPVPVGGFPRSSSAPRCCFVHLSGSGTRRNVVTSPPLPTAQKSQIIAVDDDPNNNNNNKNDDGIINTIISNKNSSDLPSMIGARNLVNFGRSLSCMNRHEMKNENSTSQPIVLARAKGMRTVLLSRSSGAAKAIGAGGAGGNGSAANLLQGLFMSPSGRSLNSSPTMLNDDSSFRGININNSNNNATRDVVSAVPSSSDHQNQPRPLTPSSSGALTNAQTRSLRDPVLQHIASFGSESLVTSFLESSPSAFDHWSEVYSSLKYPGTFEPVKVLGQGSFGMAVLVAYKKPRDDDGNEDSHRQHHSHHHHEHGSGERPTSNHSTRDDGSSHNHSTDLNHSNHQHHHPHLQQSRFLREKNKDVTPNGSGYACSAMGCSDKFVAVPLKTAQGIPIGMAKYKREDICVCKIEKIAVVEQNGNHEDLLQSALLNTDTPRQLLVNDYAQQRLERMQHEAHILSNLAHPNIVGFIDYHVEPSKQCHYLYIEYVDGGDLSSVLQTQRTMQHRVPPLSEEKLLDTFAQVVLAVEYLHRHNILHRDIKSQNVLLSKKHRFVKLTDFGTAREFDTDTTATVDNALKGSPLYLSPELCGSSSSADGSNSAANFYSEKTDMWSLGVLLFELFTNGSAFPFWNRSMDRLRDDIRHKHMAAPPRVHRDGNVVSSSAYRLVLALLHKDPRKRPTAKQVLTQFSCMRTALDRYVVRFHRDLVEPIPEAERETSADFKLFSIIKEHVALVRDKMNLDEIVAGTSAAAASMMASPSGASHREINISQYNNDYNSRRIIAVHNTNQSGNYNINAITNSIINNGPNNNNISSGSSALAVGAMYNNNTSSIVLSGVPRLFSRVTQSPDDGRQSTNLLIRRNSHNSNTLLQSEDLRSTPERSNNNNNNINNNTPSHQQHLNDTPTAIAASLPSQQSHRQYRAALLDYARDKELEEAAKLLASRDGSESGRSGASRGNRLD